MKKNNLKDPGNAHRVLKIVHSIDPGSLSGTVEQRRKWIEARLDDLAAKGFGGIVTNVPSENYLESEDNWDMFEYVLRQAFYRKMRIWLYDEEGYPSGAAGGLTLRENPQYGAKGLAKIWVKGVKGETVKIQKPRGHRQIVSVYMIGSGNELPVSLEKYLDEEGNLEYICPTDCTVYYFISKFVYEGTHSQHNVHASRRYISILNKEAVKEFVKNTYKQYKDRFGDYFGREIEAIFTDEPSLMSTYINAGLYPSRVDDEYDDTLPLLPVVPWEDDLVEKFREYYGQDIRMQLHFLYLQDEEGKDVRYRFNKMLSKIVEDSYFSTLGEFCRESNIAFSGHVLLEEEILHHPLFEGNIFAFMKHMGIPGIDMLYTTPLMVKSLAQTPKLIRSSADFYGKDHVMSEVSGHAEASAGQKIGFDMMLGAVTAQFALGVDVFTSYYNDNNFTVEENILFNETVARLGEMFAGGRSKTPVGIYYPIESMWGTTFGSDKMLYERSYDPKAIKTSQSWTELIRLMTDSHFEYTCFDQEAFCAMKEGNALWPEVVIFPYVCVLEESVLEGIKFLADKGVGIIFDSLSYDVFVPGKERYDIFQILSKENVINCTSPREVIKAAGAFYSPQMVIKGLDGTKAEDVIFMSRTNTDMGYENIGLLVNCSLEPVKLQITWYNGEKSAGIGIYDPLKAEWSEINALNSADGGKIFNLTLDGCRSVVCIPGGKPE